MRTSQTNHTNTCPACDSEDLDESVGEFDGVCTECGFVIHDSTELSAPDWRVVDEDDAQPDDDWLATCRVQNATEQRLAEAFDALEEFADRLTLPVGLRCDAADIYCEALLAGTTDGRDTTTMVAACVRLASLQAEKPIPANRLAEPPDIDSRQFHRSYSVLSDDLDQWPPTPKPVDYLPFLDRELAVDDERLQASVRMLEEVAGDPALVGKDPSGIAGAALYLTVDEQTQSSIADTIGVSTETIRHRVAQLRELVSDG